MSFHFILKGRKGAVQVLLSTQYFPMNVMEENIKREGFGFPYKFMGKLKDTFDCWDVGFHSIKRPHYLRKEDKRVCDLNDCGYCYYDGSSLRGRDDKLGELFMEKGVEGIWKYLEEEYVNVFKNKNLYGLGLLVKTITTMISKGEKNGNKNKK